MTKDESAAKILEAITTIIDTWFLSQMDEYDSEDPYGLDIDDDELPF